MEIKDNKIIIEFTVRELQSLRTLLKLAHTAVHRNELRTARVPPGMQTDWEELLFELNNLLLEDKY